MARVTSQKTRQAILVTGDPLDLEGPLPDKIQLFNEAGEPLMIGMQGSRTTVEYVTASLAGGAQEVGTFEVYPSWRMFKVTTNKAARVRIYATEAQRDADVNRSIGTKPVGNHGRLFELVTTPDILTWTLSPVVDLSSDDETGIFPITVTNLEDTSGSVIVTFHYIRTE